MCLLISLIQTPLGSEAGHREIEHGLHYRRDVILREAQSQLRMGHAPHDVYLSKIIRIITTNGSIELAGRRKREDTPMMWGYGWGGMFLMLLGTALWIALLVVLVLAFIRWLDGKTTTSAPAQTSVPPGGLSAMEILRQRYARGEIDTATFEQMRERLEASSQRH